MRPTRPALLTVVATLFACSPQPTSIPVVEATIAHLQTAMLEGRTTCRLVVQAYLDRIEAYDQHTGLNAITVTNPNALARADELDAALVAGEEPGPLFCAPMLVKDNFDTRDLPTTGGSVALLESVPPDDATIVRRIREAGGIVLAKTNMAEWAFSPRQTVSSSYDTTRNAYDLTRVPAGSSGGTASGVAASFGVAGLGSDTGNSIRGPSSHLALFGIRSTIGLTSRDGVIPLSFGMDIAGPMTRTVADGARVFSVVAGYDPADPYTEPARDMAPVDYTAFLDADALEGARIGVLRPLVDTDDADPEVTAVFERAVEDLSRLGAEVVDPLPFADFDGARRAVEYCRSFRYDMAQYLMTLGAEAPIRDVAEVLETGQYSDYVEGRLRSYTSTEDVGPPAEWEPPCPTYLENGSRLAYHDAVVRAMDEAQVDALIYPTWTNPPAPIDDAIEQYRGDNSQIVAPATGLPAATVPMGWTRSRWPAGLQIVARPFDEGTLFGIAYAYEQGTLHRRPPEAFPPLSVAEGN